MPHHVVYCFDENYEPHFGASVMSLILNYRGPGEDLNIHVITDHAAPEFLDKIEMLRKMFRCGIHLIHPTKAQLAWFSELPVNSEYLAHMRRSTWYRLLIPILLPDNIERALYLDADTIVHESVHPLLETDIGNYTIMGVNDSTEGLLAKHHGLKQYINAGVLLLDLKRWRRGDHVKGCLETAQTHAEKIRFADQCAINLHFQDAIGLVDPRWNQFIKPESKPNSRNGIWHFVSSDKPWQIWYERFLSDIYWHYRRVSPWCNGAPLPPQTIQEYEKFSKKLFKESKFGEAQKIHEEIIQSLKKQIP